MQHHVLALEQLFTAAGRGLTPDEVGRIVGSQLVGKAARSSCHAD
jgi:hypothetical protein